jgi:hypothetical protein
MVLLLEACLDGLTHLLLEIIERLVVVDEQRERITIGLHYYPEDLFRVLWLEGAELEPFHDNKLIILMIGISGDHHAWLLTMLS